MHLLHLNCVLLDPGSGCTSPLSIDGVAFGVVTWSTSRIPTVQVRQTVLDRYTLVVSMCQWGALCYVQVECLAQLELAGYDQVALPIVNGASASGTR